MRQLGRRAGFTLVEILVALAVFSVLMAVITSLFVNSIRAMRTGDVQREAFEEARAALTVIQDDLVAGFSQHQSSDALSFYGTPIGMVFVGVAKMTSAASDLGIARITYVVYNVPNADPFPGALESVILDPQGNPIYDAGGNVQYYPPADGFPYQVLRYVEPGVSDLDSLPFDLGDDAGTAPGGGARRVWWQVLNELLQQHDLRVSPPIFDPVHISNLPTTGEDVEKVRAKKHELWIRALAGGDVDVPNAWDPQVGMFKEWDPQSGAFRVRSPYPVATDYAIAGNVLSIASLQDRMMCPTGPDPNRAGCENALFTPFFDYDMAAAYVTDTPQHRKPANPWWNDPACDAYWGYSVLPEIVSVSFWLMYGSPYPGAPDFRRHFSLQVNLPVAYVRVSSLTVYIDPAGARDAGAKWQVDAGPWHESASTQTVALGTHTVAFNSVPGWTTPPAQEVTIRAAESKTVTVTY